MKFSTSSITALGVGAVLLLTGCSQSMFISNVDYSQPIETVLQPNEEGMVHDVQHGLQFNILPIQYEETRDTSSVSVEEVRMIRGREGYYYITASGFTNVYVLTPDKSGLKLKKKLKIADEGVSEPAFNQRKTHIQLLNRSDNTTYTITSGEIRRTENSGANEEAK